MKSVLEGFKKSTGISVNVVTIPDSFEQNLQTKWAAGQRPDILFYQPAPSSLANLNAKKNLQDLGDMKFVQQTKFGLADAGTMDGVHYTATYDFPSVFGIYYNKKVFSDNNIAIPKTVADLDSAAATLKAKGVVPFGVTGGDNWSTQIPFMEASTDLVHAGDVKKINNGSEKFTDAKWIDAFSVAPGWVSKGWVNPDYKSAQYAAMPAQLQAGSVAMYPMASWMAGTFTDTSDIGFFPWPSTSEAVQYQSGNVASVQLPKTGDSAREAASRKFVDYITVGQGYKTLNAALGSPSIMKGVPDPEKVNPLLKEAASLFAGGKSLPSLDTQLAYGPSNRADLSLALVTGSLTAQEFASQYQDAFDKLRKLQG